MASKKLASNKIGKFPVASAIAVLQLNKSEPIMKKIKVFQYGDASFAEKSISNWLTTGTIDGKPVPQGQVQAVIPKTPVLEFVTYDGNILTAIFSYDDGTVPPV